MANKVAAAVTRDLLILYPGLQSRYLTVRAAVLPQKVYPKTRSLSSRGRKGVCVRFFVVLKIYCEPGTFDR